MKRTYQLFQAPHCVVAVPINSERLARVILERDHHTGKDPGWRWLGAVCCAALLGCSSPDAPPPAQDAGTRLPHTALDRNPQPNPAPPPDRTPHDVPAVCDDDAAGCAERDQ